MTARRSLPLRDPSSFGAVLSIASAALLLAAPPLSAAEDAGPASTAPAEAATALPSGEEILRRHVEAIGGEKAVKSQRNRMEKATLAIPAQNLKGEVTSWLAAPDRFLVVMELPGIGIVQQGHDGDVAWSHHLITGPRILDGKEKEQLVLDTSLHAAASLVERFDEVETLAVEDFEGTRAYKVRMVSPSGREMVSWFDVETGLQRGLKTTASMMMGDIPVTMSFSGYEEHGGVKVPTRSEQTILGMPTTLTVEEVRVNVDDLPSFEPPPEVLALLEERALRGAPAGGSGEVPASPSSSR